MSHFSSRAAFYTGVCSLGLLAACSSNQPRTDADPAPVAGEVGEDATVVSGGATDVPFKISLAQWSLNKHYREGGNDPYGFAADAKERGFDAIEYVSQLYNEDLGTGDDHAAAVDRVFTKLDSIATAEDVFENLIMIDGEGELGSADEAARKEAIEKHKHYVDAAAKSEIETIRVNAAGEGDSKTTHDQAVKSLSELGEYAAPKDVNVVVENHGGYSSDPVWLAGVMEEVGMDNVGILPDFGNFCRKYEEGGYEAGCADSVPPDSIYAAVGMWMPYAKAVSAKSHDFSSDGEESEIDYARMMDTVVAHGYTGYVGVEYEGSDLSEDEGIEATRELLMKVSEKASPAAGGR